VQQGSRRGATRFCATLAASLSFQLAPAASSAADPAPGLPASSTTLSAEHLAARAYELHESGRYAEAIAIYLEAYQVSNAAVALLNVATIYDRKLHEPGLAADYYRRYLAAPDAEPDLVKKAAARLTALKEEEAAGPAGGGSMAAGTVALPPPGAADLPPPAHATTLRPLGIAVTCAGIASVGVGLVLGLLAKDKNDGADAVCAGRVCSSPEGVRLAHQAGDLATASTAAFFGGLAVAAGGIVMVLLAPRRLAQPSTHLAIAPVVGPFGAGLGVRGSF
jgi:hypothetical protein